MRLPAPLTMAKGAAGYIRFPAQRAEWGGPFNGQAGRLAIFRELNGAFRFDAIFETGAYRGSTAEYLARETGRRVRTVEADPWSWGFCCARFLLNPAVSVKFGDSRDFIRALRLEHARRPFFYLDAHWGADLPLRDELRAILQRWEDVVVMIDDFQVPGDDGYGFDSYGDGKVIGLSHVVSLLQEFQVKAYFPLMPGERESGACRGCAVLLGRATPCVPFATLRPHDLGTCEPR